MKLVIAEKPSVAQSLAKVIGANQKKDGYLEGNGYAEYRKCGYSKKFLEEHRQEILLHKAAKNAFDELHLKKLPKIKDLSAEYAEILAEKKKLYGEYRQVKKDMQEIQRAKYDIDQFLKSDEEQKKERVRKHNITR